ncbi:glucose-6-phosphate dehydrogenase [Patescibacteria group bacterium]|nr:MAG: glucose-6-phosphate dehydrogenase [Patescibacteria group bacterium]
MQSPPTTLIIFGATGDLTVRKIIPSLYFLFENSRLPANFSVIGVSRRDMSGNAFRDFVAGVLTNSSRGNLDYRSLDRFLDIFTYSKVEFQEEAGYQELARTLDMRDRSHGKTNRLLYMAVPPTIFPTIFAHSGFKKIIEGGSVGGLLARVIVEKPFGEDAASAQSLEQLLSTCFTEDQIYRVDHYLAKDILQQIVDFRFANNLFEESWDKDAIESVHIRLWETLGIEKRGNFYDKIGTFKDVGQNHMLEMLALATMDAPKSFDAQDLRAERIKVLQKLRPPQEKDMATHAFRAQHEGYRSIEGVDPNSTTETYFAVRAEIDSPRWSGVSIFLESGKRMHEARKEIIVTFKKPFQNTITFRIEPREEMIIEFMSKKRGIFEEGRKKREFRFSLHEMDAGKQYLAEYGKMIIEAIEGDQKLFLNKEEVAAAWHFTDPIINAWKKNLVPLASYVPGSDEAIHSFTQNPNML